MREFVSKSALPENVLLDRFKKREAYNIKLSTSSPFLQEYGKYLYFSESMKNVSIKTALKYFTIVSDLVEFLCKVNGVNYETFNASNLETVKLIELKNFIENYNVGLDANGKPFMNQAKTINVHISAIKKFYKWCYNNEHIQTNVSFKLESYKTQKKQNVITLDDDEVNAFIELVKYGKAKFRDVELSLSKKQLEWHHLHNKRDLAIFSIMLYHGLRIEEVFNLNISSFDFRKNEFTTYRKRDKFGTFYMQSEVAEIVKDYIDNERPTSDDTALFLSAHGETIKRFSIEQMRKMLKKYLKIINPTKQFSPHKIRATFGTKVTNEFDIHTAQLLLGHENIQTTEIYVKADENKKKEVSLKIRY